MLNNLRIGIKLGLGFALVILLLLVLAGVMMSSLSTIEGSTEKVMTTLKRSIVANNITDTANLMLADWQSYLLVKDAQSSQDFVVKLQKAKSLLETVRDNTKIEANKTAAQEALTVLDEVGKDQQAYLKQEELIQSIKASGSGYAAAGITGLAELVKVISESVKDEKVIERTTFAEVTGIMELEMISNAVLQARDNLFAANTVADNEKWGKEFPERMGNLITKMGELNAKIPPGDITDRLLKCEENFTTWQGIAKNFVANHKILVEMRDPLLKKIKSIIPLSASIVERANENMLKEGTGQEELISVSERTGYTVSGIALLVGILAGIILSRNITAGIRRAVVTMDAVAHEGDVLVEVAPADQSRYDEIGDMFRALSEVIKQFQSVEHLAKELADGNYNISTTVRGDKDTMNVYINKMLDQVNNVMREIHESATHVAISADEASRAARDLSNGAQLSASSLEEITASMREIGGQTKKNAESASQARDLAQGASKAANEGQEAMKNMTESMGQITQNSHEIQRVIKVIDDIAFQTNLLALNAAVEAARAGQHGKGFAVVAEEVRNLAARSAKAAKETSELIAKSSHEIERGGTVAAHTAEVLNAIVGQVQQTTEIIGGIAAASNEQAVGVNQVSVGLHQIDSVTQQNTAAAEESASAAHEMSALAAELQKEVAQFKLRS